MKKIFTLMISAVVFVASPAFAMDDDQGMEHKGLVQPTRAAAVVLSPAVTSEDGQLTEEKRAELLQRLKNLQTRLEEDRASHHDRFQEMQISMVSHPSLGFFPYEPGECFVLQALEKSIGRTLSEIKQINKVLK